MLGQTMDRVPMEWVPPSAMVYLAHTEHGRSIRALARGLGCHASTVLRQVRRFEQRRDDPLIDHALQRLGAQGVGRAAFDSITGGTDDMSQCNTKGRKHHDSRDGDEALIEREALRVLRRLAEPGACLAVATGMENAVVVREGPGGETLRTAILARTVAESMALRDWIAARGAGRIARYYLTAAGRGALKDLLERTGRATPPEARGRARYGAQESPLIALSRRRDRDGKRFLGQELLAAGERLREDYELAQMGTGGPISWETALSGGGAPLEPEAMKGTGPEAASVRVRAALGDLGPGLGDVVLRCCCLLEGMETVEKRMGWAARSGKIVLRIALQRLRRHYDETQGRWSPMVG